MTSRNHPITAPDGSQEEISRPILKVIGVGGGGNSAVYRMFGLMPRGVSYIVANTDARALAKMRDIQALQIGEKITGGRGAGSRPEIGEQAANAMRDEIRAAVQDADLLFITAGMGGGTGTGAAPVVAEIAAEMGVTSIAVITLPFRFEGNKRMKIARNGMERLKVNANAMLTISNQKLLELSGNNLNMFEAFKMVDEILYRAIRGITALVRVPGLINVDFADLKTVLSERGAAIMGVGEAKGINRIAKATRQAFSNPLFDETSITGARGILINVTGNQDMSLEELNEAGEIIPRLIHEMTV